jgi:hypothetical protein
MIRETVKKKVALGREALLTKLLLKSQTVDVSEFGEDAQIRVRALTALERDRWDAANYSGGKDVNMIGYKSRFIALCACDENDQRIFNDEDASVIGEWPSHLVERVFVAAGTLNGLLKSAVDAIEGKSEKTAPADGAGPSPGDSATHTRT